MRKILFILLLPAVVASSPAQPAIRVVEGTTFDLGKVYRGTVVEKRISLENPGSDTLVVSRVEVSCGCTGTIVSRDRIPPGGRGLLSVTFNSKNFVGPVHKTLTVHSNAAAGNQTVVEFTANVIDEIGLDPQYLFFQDAEVKRRSTVMLTVTNNGTTPLSLEGFHTQMKGLVLKLPPEPITPGASARISAEFTPEAANPLISEGVFLRTSNPHQPEIYLQVFGNVRDFKFE